MNVVKVEANGDRTMTWRKPKGKLIIIGGAEKHEDGLNVLEAVAKEMRRKRHPLLLITAALSSPGYGPGEYRKIFRELGLDRIEVLEIPTREDAYIDANVAKVAEAGGIFFTGGDQLRITSQLGDTPIYQLITQRYADGCMIAGTSAGAAAMPDTMIIGGPGDESNQISSLSMAPGLGLIKGVVIDSHFAERGRMGRLLGAVAQNPRNLGLGIDESTAIVVEDGERFTVIGSGAVYIVDGTGISYSSLSEDNAEGVLNITDVKLHVLGEGEGFDIVQVSPIFASDARNR